jgi:hypothetical protein
LDLLACNSRGGPPWPTFAFPGIERAREFARARASQWEPAVANALPLLVEVNKLVAMVRLQRST